MEDGKKKRAGHHAPPGYDGSSYSKPSVAVDVAIVSYMDGGLKALLIERGREPYRGYWALPGGFVEIDEGLSTAAAREVWEETGVSDIDPIELGAFGDPDRDPRGRVISVAYLALTRADKVRPRPGDDAAKAEWHPLLHPPELAFDHDRILAAARARLREIAVLSPRLFDLLPDRFSMRDLMRLSGEVMGRDYGQENFEKALASVPGFSRDHDGLYRYDRSRFQAGDLYFLLLE